MLEYSIPIWSFIQVWILYWKCVSKLGNYLTKIKISIPRVKKFFKLHRCYLLFFDVKGMYVICSLFRNEIDNDDNHEGTYFLLGMQSAIGERVFT